MSGNVAIFFPNCLRNLGFRFYNENIPHQGRRMLKNKSTVRLLLWGGGGLIWFGSILQFDGVKVNNTGTFMCMLFEEQ